MVHLDLEVVPGQLAGQDHLRSTSKKDRQSGQAECHLAQHYEYEMPSDTSHINTEVASSYPTYIMDSDIHDHSDNNDYNHYSTFEEQDYSEHDYSDFYDDLYSHDTNSAYLSFPEDIPSNPYLNPQLSTDFCSFSSFPSVELVNPEPDKEMNKVSMPDTLTCLDTAGTIHNTPTAENLDTESYLILPDYAGLILPPLVDTVFSLQNARFKYPPRSAPIPEMHTDNRSDEQILADIVRTCSLNLTKEEVNIYEKMVGKTVTFPESIRQDTYRVPKTLLDQAIKDVNMTKSQAEN